jgi:hypothetical protein
LCGNDAERPVFGSPVTLLATRAALDPKREWSRPTTELAWRSAHLPHADLILSTPHDALFKYVFSQPEHVAGELRALLPADVSQHLDWSSLTPVPASFVDERLAGRHADLLFSVSCRGRETLIYVLLEHQSRSDALMPFRLLRYVVRIWDSFLAARPEARALPPVLPVVIHHGDVLADLRSWRDLLVAVAAAPSGLAAFAALLRYTLQVGDVAAEELHRFVHELGPAPEETS